MTISTLRSWLSPVAWIGSARDGFIAGVAKSTPLILSSLKDSLNNVQNFEDITSLISRLNAVKRDPECEGISVQIDSWLSTLGDLDEDSYADELRTIKGDIIKVIEMQNGPVDRLITNACQTAPPCIDRSLQLLQNSVLDTEELIRNLNDLLSRITTEEEKSFIRENIETLRRSEPIPVGKLRALLEKKNKEFSGPIAKNAVRLGPILGQGLIQVFHKLQEGLLDHGDLYYNKIYQCRDSIQTAFYTFQIPQRLGDELGDLVEMLRNARDTDSDFLDIFTQLERLIYSQESVEQSNLDLLRNIDFLLAKLLQPQFFKRPGLLLNIFPLIAPLYTKNEDTIPLLEPEQARRTSPPLQKITNFAANHPLPQNLPPPPIAPVVVTPEEITKSLKSYLNKTKIPTLFQLTKWIGIDVHPPEEGERTDDFFKRVVAPLQTAGINPIPTIKHFIVNVYDDISHFLIRQAVMHWTPLFLTNLEKYFFATSLDPIPLIKLTRTLKQTILDLKDFSETSLSREDFLKEKRFNQYSIRSSIALGWRLHKWTAQKITEKIRLESLIETLFTDIEVPFLKMPLNQLISTLMTPINFLVRKILFIGVRSFLSLIPHQTISNKILDKFLTQEALNKLYKDGVTSFLAQWESPPINPEAPMAPAAQPEPIRIGPTKIDQKVVKQLLFSIVNMAQNHEGLGAQAFGKNILSWMPSLAQTYLLEEATIQMAYAYDTAFDEVSHQTLKATIRDLFSNAVEEPELEPGDGQHTDIVALEERLHKLLAKELFPKDGMLGTEGLMRQAILALTETLTVTIRELVTEKELVKRIILDQLFLSA